MSPRPRRTPSALNESELARLLRRQDGVTSRRQVRELGGADLDIELRLRRRDRVRGSGPALEPCRLAGQVARISRARGWAGTPRPCGRDCDQPDTAGSSA